jgi:hypothetical protein
MPANNRFHHQPYPTTPVTTPVLTTLRHDVAKGIDYTRLHTELNVREVVLVHGTFMGDDPFAVAEIMKAIAGEGWVGKALRSVANKITANTKALADKIAKDVGNYTTEYRDQFQELVGTDPQVKMLDPTWSSQNNHYARADLAVRLLVHLHELQLDTDHERVLLWGHSHAGNGFALLTNLLANHAPSVERFFAVAGDDPPKHWRKAKEILQAEPSPSPLAKSLVIASFGTPVRYGWDTNGYRSLIHVSHHRPTKKSQITTKPLFPPHAMGDVIKATHGDWVQAFAIAGTDVAVPPTAAKHRELSELFEQGLKPPEISLDLKFVFPQMLKEVCGHWKTGTRCHSDGINLLVDYEPCGRKTVTRRPIEESMFGHGVATVKDWLPRHLALIMHWIENDGE